MEKYAKKKKIGAGSFGRIYLVEDETTGCVCVLKEVDLCEGAGDVSLEQAKEEALAEVYYLNKLHEHPNIISIRECFENEKMQLLYIVMEFAEGGDLENRIREQAESGIALHEEVILEWFVQICLVKHTHAPLPTFTNGKARPTHATAFLCILSRTLLSTCSIPLHLGDPAYPQPTHHAP